MANGPGAFAKSTNFDGSLDAIYAAEAASRQAARARGAAEGEDFDFCCPSAPDDLFGRVTYRDDSEEPAASGEETDEKEDRGPLGGLLNLMGF